MVIRVDTKCPRCKRENVVFGRNHYCNDCRTIEHFKSQLRQKIKARKMTLEIQQMSELERVKLHNKLMKELKAEDKDAK